MSGGRDGAILTLEPLIEAVRVGVEGAGWELSGLQKTTSHQFEGRWDGESTRSAYLFFHQPVGPDFVSVDVYLDETSRGLTGNLALVADLRRFAEVGPAREVLEALAAASAREIGPEHRRPLTLRFRLADVGEVPGDAETEVRFKVRIARRTITEGAEAVTSLAEEVMVAFAKLLSSPEITVLAPEPEPDPDLE